MTRLAIISCKAKKKDYKCNAEEMYSDSPQYKHQMHFIKDYYDDYMILSLKYGIISRDTIISPYNMSLTKSSNMVNASPTVNNESKQRWVLKVKKQLSQLYFKYDRIDLHLSDAYATELQEILFALPDFNLVKLPNMLQFKQNYHKAAEINNNEGDVNTEVVSNYVKWRNNYKNELLNKKIVLPWK